MTGPTNKDDHPDLVARFSELVQDSIVTYSNNHPQVNLEAPAAQASLTAFLIECMAPLVEECEEEIKSLWFMLDELKLSDTRAPEIADRVASTINTQLALWKLMQKNRGDA